MIDYEALREWIKNSGMLHKHIASKLGMTPANLSSKLNNHRDFRASDISAFVTELHMSVEDRNKIFFKSNID